MADDRNQQRLTPFSWLSKLADQEAFDRRLTIADAPLTITRVSIGEDAQVVELIQIALREDVGGGDVTSRLLPNAQEPAVFRLWAKETGIFCGAEVAPAVLHTADPTVRLAWTHEGSDGGRIGHAPIPLAEIRGALCAILAVERVFLNFLQRLCGIASLTRRFVDAVAGTGAAIYDTRKTAPGWRILDKYAVRCGGGSNHRFGLHDAVLIKDNHLAGVPTPRLAAAVFDLLNRLGDDRGRVLFVAVEAQDPAQVAELLKVVGVDLILLDNFSLGMIREAVALRDESRLRGKVALEVSGGVRLDSVRAIAETGVERISVGTITHSAPALDLSLERV